MKWESSTKTVHGEIMKTDIFCEILSEGKSTQTKALAALEEVFQLFRDFEKRYSRFIQGNELWELNEGLGGIVSEEFFSLLEQAAEYHRTTEGIFDPSVLPVLEQTGYEGAYTGKISSEKKVPFSELKLDRLTLTTIKPRDLKIDLGGIGKGFIVDTVANFLGKRFENFIIDAGGDIYIKGSNRKENYPYWAVDVEHPLKQEESIALLLLSDRAVATSGRNRRRWKKDNEEKHHIIDPRTDTSAASDFLSVTVIAENVTLADVLAKTLFISGEEKGSQMAEKLKIPAIFIKSDASVTINHFAKQYVWKSH